MKLSENNCDCMNYELIKAVKVLTEHIQETLLTVTAINSTLRHWSSSLMPRECYPMPCCSWIRFHCQCDSWLLHSLGPGAKLKYYFTIGEKTILPKLGTGKDSPALTSIYGYNLITRNQQTSVSTNSARSSTSAIGSYSNDGERNILLC